MDVTDVWVANDEGAFLVRAVHDETRGWQWVSEPL
jgi:hypothetical protein